MSFLELQTIFFEAVDLVSEKPIDNQCFPFASFFLGGGGFARLTRIDAKMEKVVSQRKVLLRQRRVLSLSKILYYIVNNNAKSNQILLYLCWNIVARFWRKVLIVAVLNSGRAYSLEPLCAPQKYIQKMDFLKDNF